MARDLVAGIDSSTQSCTVQLRRLDDGAVIAEARAPHPLTTPPLSDLSIVKFNFVLLPVSRESWASRLARWESVKVDALETSPRTNPSRSSIRRLVNW